MRRKYRCVPPYTSSMQMTWSPVLNRWITADVAAMPDANAIAVDDTRYTIREGKVTQKARAKLVCGCRAGT